MHLRSKSCAIISTVRCDGDCKIEGRGAIPFGRTNMDEFAMGSSTENSAAARRQTLDFSRFPAIKRRIAAVVQQMRRSPRSLGHWRIIRQPAALCGCVGLKPTYGRISRFGLVAFASSLDQIGPFTKTVRDARSCSMHLRKRSAGFHQPR